jgi:hypothetical protein
VSSTTWARAGVGAWGCGGRGARGWGSPGDDGERGWGGGDGVRGWGCGGDTARGGGGGRRLWALFGTQADGPPSKRVICIGKLKIVPHYSLNCTHLFIRSSVHSTCVVLVGCEL